ncbi:MAG: TorF family putative porin [Gammaproteobacteria bacterium]|nr:TorF family putative porin [Gammaproteobacteria bacterium]
MYCKKTLMNSLVAGSLLASASAAQAELSGNVALTTDYVWRGYSQTMENPAIQGGFDFSDKSGFYLGTWGSNVDFGGPENLELDLYGGWSGELSGGLGVDAGVISYRYFDDVADPDFTEAYVGLSFGMFSAKASFQIDGPDLGNYYEAGADIPLGEKLTLALHVGKYDYDEGPDPVDYSIGVSTAVSGFDLGITAYGVNNDGELVYGKLGDDRVVVSVSKSL